MDTLLKDPGLAPAGLRKIDFAASRMPVLSAVADELARTRPLAGHRIAACLHVTTETANLCRALHAGGAELALCASNPLSTKDDVAAAIHEETGAAVFAVHGADRDTFYRQVAGVAGQPADPGRGRRRRPHRHHPQQPPRPAGRHRRRHRGDLDRRPAGPQHGPRGRARLPAAGRQRRRHQAPVRQPLRHRPVDPRRHPAGDQRAAGRQGPGGGRLRLVRPRGGHPGPRHGGAGGGLRGRPAPGPGGGDGGLPGAAGGRGGPGRGHLRDRHRQPRRPHRSSTCWPCRTGPSWPTPATSTWRWTWPASARRPPRPPRSARGRSPTPGPAAGG